MNNYIKTVFSFRGESAVDLIEFVVAIADGPVHGLFITHVNTREPYNEPHVEIATYQSITLEQVRDIMRAVPDGHVMLQTLRQLPLADNSLERDYNIE